MECSKGIHCVKSKMAMIDYTGIAMDSSLGWIATSSCLATGAMFLKAYIRL